MAHRTPSSRKCFEVLLWNPLAPSLGRAEEGLSLSPLSPNFYRFAPRRQVGFSPAGGIWGIQKVRGWLKGSFFLSFFFLTKILRKSQGGRGKEGGPNLAKCPQTFQCLLGASSKRNGPVSSPLSEVPSPQSGSVPRKFGTFFFLFFFKSLGKWGRDLRELRRGKTDTDKDRDRTGDIGSLTEGEEVESHREPEREGNTARTVGSWRASGKEQGDNSMQQTLISTKWVLKSRVRGGRSESLRSDWLRGREGRKEARGFSVIPISDATSVSPLDKLQHKRLRSDCRRDFQEMEKMVR